MKKVRVKTLDELNEMLCDFGFEDAITFADDFLDAVIGVDAQDGRVIYDYDLMVQSMAEKDGITSEEAIEWIEYNTIRSLPYMGEKRPIILNHLPD